MVPVLLIELVAFFVFGALFVVSTAPGAMAQDDSNPITHWDIRKTTSGDSRPRLNTDLLMSRPIRKVMTASRIKSLLDPVTCNTINPGLYMNGRL